MGSDTPQTLGPLAQLRDSKATFSNKMQISNCLTEELGGKISVNKISVAMEIIKNRLPALPLLSGYRAAEFLHNTLLLLFNYE